MNIVDEFRRDQNRVLDRLVDGELGTEERRALIAALDDEPGGWRQCALAFLESQSWRWQISRLAVEPLATQTGALAAVSSNLPPTARAVPFGTCLAIAAGLLLAFGLGVLVPQNWPIGNPVNDTLIAQATREINAVTQRDASAAETDTITLAWEGEGNRIETFKLPIEPGEIDEKWLTERKSSLPADLISELREAGLEVNSRYEFYPFDLFDGRQVIVPVEQVEIRDPRPVEYY